MEKEAGKEKTLNATNAFYIGVDGIRCYCLISELVLSNNSMSFHAKYNEKDIEEDFNLYSDDGFIYRGNNTGVTMELRRFSNKSHRVFVGKWVYGNNRGEWVIEADN